MIEGKVQDYEGQSDARTLHDAHAIRTDGKRHKNALKHLKKMGAKSMVSQNAHVFEKQNAGGLPEDALKEGDESAAEERSEPKKQEKAEGGY